MAFELVYTSAPRGIKPGSSGFCTVGYTNGLAANTAAQLEALSAYKAYFPHYDEHASQNPVAYSHCRFVSSGEELHVLSRICFNGLDYTRRSNKLAHHLVLRQHDIALAPAGPAALFQQPRLFFCEWNHEPQLFPRQKDIVATDAGDGPATTWEAYTGDAGWAGTLVERYLQAPDRPTFIIYDPLQHQDMLKLLAEAMLLLPITGRWELTFNTYFTNLPAGISCAWRFCVPNSDALREARRSPGTLIIDLTQKMPAASDGKWQNLARSAIAPEAVVVPTPAGNDTADQLRVKDSSATAATAVFRAPFPSPATTSHTIARTATADQVPARKYHLVAPVIIGAMTLLLFIVGGGLALKHVLITKGAATGTDALTQRVSATTDELTPPQMAPDDAATHPPVEADTKATKQLPTANATDAYTLPAAPAAAATPAAAGAARPATEKQAIPPLDFHCLDLGIERDRSYLWLLNFPGHFQTIKLLLENEDERIVSTNIKSQRDPIQVVNDKISILGPDLSRMDIYRFVYVGRKVTITKTECDCPNKPYCTNALMGFSTSSGKEYPTYAILGISKIPDENMDDSPAGLPCTLCHTPVTVKSPVPPNPIIKIELTGDLQNKLDIFRLRLQIPSKDVNFTYAFHLPDGTTFCAKSTVVTISDLWVSKIFEPYRITWVNFDQKRKDHSGLVDKLKKSSNEKKADDTNAGTGKDGQQGDNPPDGNKLEQEMNRLKVEWEAVVAQACQEFNARGMNLVRVLSQGTLSLRVVDSHGNYHVIKDDIRMQVKP